MNKQRGFTLIELIFTMLIFAILAGIVVEIVAGPIKSYIWVQANSALVQEGELALENMRNELSTALYKTVHVKNEGNDQTLVFQKIIYKGLLKPSYVKPFHLVSMEPFAASLLDQQKEQDLYLYFPLFHITSSLYRVKLTNALQEGLLTVMERDFDLKLDHPMPFYIVSMPIYYHYSAAGHLLTRIEKTQEINNEALLSNHIKHCYFLLFKDSFFEGVSVSVHIGRGKNNAITLTRPLYTSGI